MKKAKQKPSVLSKQSKYIPSKEQANTLIIYFMHNNFQDFNTWQQISRSKCQFEYNETKENSFECKATLKWDDTSLPVISGNGASRNKKNAKKKALSKLVENLIYMGYIGYGFKDYDFIRKLPKRIKQSSDEESQIQTFQMDENIKRLIQCNNLEDALLQINLSNFDLILPIAIKEGRLELVVQILRKIQNNNRREKINIEAKPQDLQSQQQWQNSQVQLGDPFEEDLADILKFQQLQPFPNSKSDFEAITSTQEAIPMDLPHQTLTYHQGTISFQHFHPIEYTFIFRRNIIEKVKSKPNERSDYFSDFYRQIPMPNFQNELELQPLSYKKIQNILNIFLEFAYNHNLVVKLLSIFEREITTCKLETNNQQQNIDFFLKQMAMICSEFSFLLSRKCKMLTLCIEGLINIENDRTLTFTPKQPQEILMQKIHKKVNTNEIEQLPQFTNQEYVLLVSKLDPEKIYIAQMIQCFPVIKLKSLTFLVGENQKQKLPFTLFKLANAKIYNRLSKSIATVSKNKLESLRNNTFIIQEKPTYPVLSVIQELLAEWVALNETVLLVSQNYHEIYMYLLEKGFKIAKITQKAENIVKKQIVCCSPSGACSDLIKNHAFTRVFVEGAQRVSLAMATLSFSKGCKKIYLMGDKHLPKSIILSKFSLHRKMQTSPLHFLCPPSPPYTFPSPPQPHPFQSSLLSLLSTFFYNKSLHPQHSFTTPLIKGFPWPCGSQRVAFVDFSGGAKRGKGNLEMKIKICCQIVAQCLKTGYIQASEICCLVVEPRTRALLVVALMNMFQNQQHLGIKPTVSDKMVSYITGSKFAQKNLSIVLGEGRLKGEQVLGGLLQGRRGVVFLGDFGTEGQDKGLDQGEQEEEVERKWREFWKWVCKKKLVLRPKNI